MLSSQFILFCSTYFDVSGCEWVTRVFTKNTAQLLPGKKTKMIFFCFALHLTKAHEDMKKILRMACTQLGYIFKACDMLTCTRNKSPRIKMTQFKRNESTF